jgi:hypothetical protein
VLDNRALLELRAANERSGSRDAAQIRVEEIVGKA